MKKIQNNDNLIIRKFVIWIFNVNVINTFRLLISFLQKKAQSLEAFCKSSL